MSVSLKTVAVLILLFVSLGSRADEPSFKDLKYLENKGQWPNNVIYKTGVGGGDIYLENNKIMYSFRNQEDLLDAHELEHENKKDQADKYLINCHAYELTFLNSNQSVEISRAKEQSGIFNFFHGNDKKKWATDVKAFGQVEYNNLYNGIDLVIYSKQGDFKYDFIVKPNANTEVISLNYKGLNDLRISEKGDLIFYTSIGEYKELKPYAFQNINGRIVEVKCNYVLYGTNLSFNFPNGYDKTQVLVIDPVLIGATLSGTASISENYGHCATFDDLGNIYTGARSFGTGYPTNIGAFQVAYGGGYSDIAISKLDPTGSNLIYATYLGGSEEENPHSMYVQNNELYVLGSSSSSNYPVSNSAYQGSFAGTPGLFTNDIVITHLNSSGNGLVGSTYVGGSGDDGTNGIFANYGDNYRGEIIVNSVGEPYISCSSSSSNFPTTAGAYQTSLSGGQDAVIFKMSNDLSSLQWSTYFGGPMADAGYGLKLDGSGNVFVTGSVGSGFFLGTGYQSAFQGGTNDAFIIKLSPNGTNVLNSTYFGASGMEQAFFLDFDPQGDVYIFGQTNLANVPTTTGVYTIPNSTQFVSKFDQNLSNLMVSTLVGGAPLWSGAHGQSPIAFLVDKCGYIYTSGHNAVAGMQTTTGALYTSGGFYLSVLEPDAIALNYATYYGGLGDHVDGGTSRFDPEGIVYQAVCTSNGFQALPGAYASSYPGFNYDVGVFKIDFKVNTLNAAFTMSPSTTGCAPLTVNFTNTSTGTDYIWDFDDGSPLSIAYQPSHTFLTPGVFDVMLIAIDSGSCIIRDTLYSQVVVGSPTPANAGFTDSVDCAGQQVFINNTSTTGLYYQWDMGDGTSYTDSMSFVHSYTPGNYMVELIVSDTVCNSADTITTNIQILTSVQANYTFSPSSSGCVPHTVNFTNISNGVTYKWDFGDGTPVSSINSPSHTYNNAGIFDATLIATDSVTCNTRDTSIVQIVVNPGTPVIAQFDDSVICVNQSVYITNMGTANMLYEWSMGDFTTFNDSVMFEYIYAIPGNYSVTLIVTDTICGYADTVVKSIVIPSVVVAAVTVTSTQGCIPLVVSYTDNSNGIQNIWLFGDASVPVVNSASPLHTFTTAGLFTTQLITIDSATCNIADTAIVVITAGASTPVIADFIITQLPDCDLLTILSENNSTGDSIIYEWSMGDGTIFIDSVDVTYQYINPGNYTITLIATDTLCNYADTISQVLNVVGGMKFNIISPPVLCNGDSALLITEADQSQYDFVWSSGDSIPSVVVKKEGTYWVKVYDSICEAYDTITVSYAPKYDIGTTIEQCYLGQGVHLEIDVDNASYRWGFGSIEKSILVEEPGDYPFSLIDEFGCSYDGIFMLVEAKSSNFIYVPNAFTPDGDRLNDEFKPVATGLKTYDFAIFNRWGDKVFESDDITKGWDGIFEGRDSPEFGVYVYRLTFSNECTQKAPVTAWGHLTLVR